MWKKCKSWLFPKRYYLVFTKKVSTAYSNGTRGKTNYVVTALYRKKNKDGKMKFYIDHDLHNEHLLTWWTAKWWMFLVSLYGRKSKRLFAYKLPHGTVFMKKAEL